MQNVYEINEPSQFGRLREIWPNLLERTFGADFFRTLDWLEVYWRLFGLRQRLRVLVVTDDSEATGIVPLVVARQKTKIGTFRVLTFPLDFWGSFYGPIGSDGQSTFQAALHYVSQQRRDWDYVDLRWIDTLNDEDDHVAGAMKSVGMRPTRRPITQIPIVDLQTTWEQYWASRSSNWRSNCRRNEKKLAKSHCVEHFRYRPRGEQHGESDPRWDLFEKCERIARISWQGKSTNGTTITHESVGEFLREVHVAAAKAGCLDLNLLLVDGQAVAFNYNYIYRGYVSSLRLGFDPQFARMGVGTVLTYRILQDSFERGDHTFDFLPGSLDVKRSWQTSIRTSYGYEYLPFQPGRVELLRAKHWLEENISRLRSQTSTAS